MATWFSLANKIWVGVIRVTSGWKHFRARTWLLVLSPRFVVRWPKIRRCCAMIMWNTIPSAYTHDGHWTRPVISKHWVTPLRFLLFDRYTCITDKRIWSPCIIFNVIVDSVNSLLVFTTSLIFLRLVFFPCVCILSDFDNIIQNNGWFLFSMLQRSLRNTGSVPSVKTVVWSCFSFVLWNPTSAFACLIISNSSWNIPVVFFHLYWLYWVCLFWDMFHLLKSLNSSVLGLFFSYSMSKRMLFYFINTHIWVCQLYS